MPGTQFDDVTPSPVPAPKKVFVFRAADGGLARIPWTAGQTFTQAVGSQLPAAVRNHTNAFDATILIKIDVIEN